MTHDTTAPSPSGPPFASPSAAPAPAAAMAPEPPHPLVAQLQTRHGFAAPTAATLDAFLDAPGHALLVFTEDPIRFKETLDLAVIAPEILRAFPGRLRAAVLFPDAARAVHARFGFRRWPALVVLKDGHFVGTIDGLRNWDEYLGEVAALLAAEPMRPPSIGIAVTAAGAAPSASSNSCGA
jgi:hydrogenase-1 operon protein HyaE